MDVILNHLDEYKTLYGIVYIGLVVLVRILLIRWVDNEANHHRKHTDSDSNDIGGR